MDEFYKEHSNLKKWNLPDRNAHLCTPDTMRFPEAVEKVVIYILKVIAILILLYMLFLSFSYLWSIRPIYHSYFYNLRGYEERDGIALVRFSGNPQILVDVETGRQLRLSYVPWRNYSMINLVSGRNAIIRNLRDGQMGLMDIDTRTMIIPFGVYRNFGVFSSSGDLTTVSLDGRMGVVNTYTGEEIFPPRYFDFIGFIYGTDRFVIVSDLRIEERRHQWGVLCLHTHELVTQLVYDRRMLSVCYDGMIVLHHREGVRVIDLYTGEEIIPVGEFDFISLVGYGMAWVGCNRYDALIEISTRDIWADFGRFSSFGRIHDYETRVGQTLKDGSRRRGTFSLIRMLESGQVGVTDQQCFDYLDSITVVWDDELSPEELIAVHERLYERRATVPDHLSHYDQVSMLSNGWVLITEGDYSWFAELTQEVE